MRVVMVHLPVLVADGLMATGFVASGFMADGFVASGFMTEGFIAAGRAQAPFASLDFPRRDIVLFGFERHGDQRSYSCARCGSTSLRRLDPATSNSSTTATSAAPGKTASHHMPAER